MLMILKGVIMHILNVDNFHYMNKIIRKIIAFILCFGFLFFQRTEMYRTNFSPFGRNLLLGIVFLLLLILMYIAYKKREVKKKNIVGAVILLMIGVSYGIYMNFKNKEKLKLIEKSLPRSSKLVVSKQYYIACSNK